MKAASPPATASGGGGDLTPAPDKGEGGRCRVWPWWLLGMLMVLAGVALHLVSLNFEYGGEREKWAVAAFVILMLTAGGVFAAGFLVLRNSTPPWRAFVAIIICGAVMRAAVFTSTPVYESDFYRYLWDGAVTAGGMSPYHHSPQEVRDAVRDGVLDEGHDDWVPMRARQSGVVIERINHPHLKTIYPPVAQAVFAAAYCIKPWSLTALRACFAVFDVAGMLLLVLLLRELGRPLHWSALWWLNPLVIKEIYNAAHMDVIVVPLVLGALYLAIRRKGIFAAVVLGFAVGAKLWPVVLAPLVVRGIEGWRRKVAAGAAFVAVSGLLLWPVAAGGLGDSSGFLSYGRTWEMNDALFMLGLWVFQAAMRVFDAAGSAEVVTRLVAAAAMGVVTIGLSWRRVDGGRDLAGRAMWIVAAVFFLSPTQFPWYYVWVLPLVALEPRGSLVLMAALVGTYYLRFPMKAAGAVWWFDEVVVFFEFAPVWLLLLIEWRRGHYVAKCQLAAHVPCQLSPS